LLRIRLTRTGKKSQPSYRIVVAEHTAPIKGRFVEEVGFYNISRTPRLLEVKQDRVKYWISVGAQPTDTVAGLLKGLGMEGMEKFIGPRNLKRKKKNPSEAEIAAEEAKNNPQPVAEAKAEEAAPEAPAEEAKAEEAAPEAPAEEAKAEEAAPEAPAEEAKAEEAAPEAAPAE